MIVVNELTKSYGEMKAIDHLNFKIKKGEVVGFLGPNGAGKSTTMKIITGFMAPSFGTASVAGFDVFENPLEVKRRVGYLPETPPLYLDMRVEDYLTYVAQLKGVDKLSIQSHVQLAIDKTNLGSVRRRLIQNLSKGFRQRVGIAQAIVSNPEVLILDEPTVGLDPVQVAEIRTLIRELRGSHTIILSTHILPEVEATCERIIIINRGKIVAEDSLANLTKLQGGRKRVLLKTRFSNGGLEQQIRSLQGVFSVTNVQKNEQQQFDIETSDSEDMIEKIAKAAMDSKSQLLEISSVRMDLEDVFMNLTYGQKKTEVGGAHV